TPERGTWLSNMQVVVPSLGLVPAPPLVMPVVVPVVPTVVPRIRAEIQAPQAGDTVGRSFVVQVLAPGADRVDVFLEPDRDGRRPRGGRGPATNGERSRGLEAGLGSSWPCWRHSPWRRARRWHPRRRRRRRGRTTACIPLSATSRRPPSATCSSSRGRRSTG